MSPGASSRTGAKGTAGLYPDSQERSGPTRPSGTPQRQSGMPLNHLAVPGLGRCALAEARRGRLYRALAVAPGRGVQPLPCAPPELLVLGDQPGDGMAAHDVAAVELHAHLPVRVPHHLRIGEVVEGEPVRGEQPELHAVSGGKPLDPGEPRASDADVEQVPGCDPLLGTRFDRGVASEPDAPPRGTGRAQIAKRPGIEQLEPGAGPLHRGGDAPVEQPRHLPRVEGERDADRRVGKEAELPVRDEEDGATTGIVNVRTGLLEVDEPVAKSRAAALADQGSLLARCAYGTTKGV